MIRLLVNGQEHELTADPAMPVWSKNSSVLRYQHLNIYYLCHNAFVSCLK